MFCFPKKCMQIEEPKGVRERALKRFSRIEGLDDVKEMLLRALESSERAHTLLIGPPACAKSLFMLEKRNTCHPKECTLQKEPLPLKPGYKNSSGKISIKKL